MYKPPPWTKTARMPRGEAAAPGAERTYATSEEGVMGIFYEQRVPTEDHVADAIEQALEEDPGQVQNKKAEAKKRAAKVKEDAKTESPTLKTGRVAIAVVIAAVLIIGAVVLSGAVDNQAIAEATKKVTTPAYVPPELSGLKSAAEWLRTLGAAWSAGLVAVLLSEKASGAV
jgi:hypothetical protein